MDKVTIVFAIDNKFVTPAYISIKSLFDSAKQTTIYECLILSSNVSSPNRKRLSKLSEGTRHEVKHVSIREKEIFGNKVTYTWPKIVYCKLYLCDILWQYEKIIFSDVDVFFRRDLAEVWNENIENVEIAAVAGEENNEDTLMHQYYPENKHQYIYWSGFMVMNLEVMRKKNWTDCCRGNLKKFESRLKMFDLEIINLTADRIKQLPLRYVFLESLWECDDIETSEDYIFLRGVYTKEEIESEKEKAVIIHYAGSRGKPWLRKNPPDYYFQYLKRLPFSLKLENIKQTMAFRIRVWGRIILRK